MNDSTKVIDTFTNKSILYTISKRRKNDTNYRKYITEVLILVKKC